MRNSYFAIPLILLISITLAGCSIFGKSKATADLKSDTGKPLIIKGERSPKDYVDTFKISDAGLVNDDFVKTVKNGRMEDSIEISFINKDIVPNKLHAGQKFEPSYFSSGWVNPSSEFSKSFIHSKGERVIITYDKKTYYGILEFNYVYKECAGDPSARSFYIKIPREQLDIVEGGNISVVYEYYNCAPRESDDFKLIRDYTKSKQKYTSWVLWLSDIEFE